MRKGRDGGGKTGKNPTGKYVYENSGHYVISSSRPLERQQLERRMLVPIQAMIYLYIKMIYWKNINMKKYT